MKKSRTTFLLGFAAFLCLSQPLLAQKDTTKNKHIALNMDNLNKNDDSLNAIILSDYAQKLSQIEKQRDRKSVV